MSAFSDFLENKLVDFLLRAQALGITGASAGAGSGPSSVYVCLHSGDPTDAAAANEITGNGYARVQVTSSLANWAGTQGAGTTTASTGTGGATSNNNVVTFPNPTPSGWGSITHAALRDAVTGGNLLFHGPLQVPKTVNAGDPPTFPAGTIVLTLA